MFRHLLVPIDGSDESIERVGRALDLAGVMRASISFTHVTVDRTASPPDADEDKLQREIGGLLAMAEAAARACGVPCSAKRARGDRFSTAIADAARDNGCDLIFMASPATPDTSAAAETLDALTRAGLSILWSKAAHGPPAQGIAIVRDEHRSLTAVLHALLHALAAVRRIDGVAPAESMRTIVRYLRIFAEAHHPKEEQHVFRRLRKRTDSLNSELEELERQHARDLEFLAQLTKQVEELSCADALTALRATRDLEATASRYAAFQWEHLGREEGVILPAARRHFRPADWAAVEAGFLRNHGSHSASAAEAEANRLYSRIVDAYGEAWRGDTRSSSADSPPLEEGG